jgi:hypothetical protein
MVIKLDLLKYKVWDKKTNSYNDHLILDQEGDLFRCIEGWGCEGGGGSEYEGIDRKRYEIHIELNAPTD